MPPRKIRRETREEQRAIAEMIEIHQLETADESLSPEEKDALKSLGYLQ